MSGLVYTITPAKYRYLSLLAVSLLVIVFMSGFGVVFILATILSAYLSGISMDKITERNDTTGLDKQVRKQIRAKVKHRKKIIVLIYMVVNLGILLVLKYFNFFSITTANLLNLFGAHTAPLLLKMAVPLGISYYTLQALSYVIDVFRGKYKAEKNIFKLSLFIAFFPQLHEGPFGRYDALMPQMCSGKPITLNQLYSCVGKLLWGLFKIFMVANRAAILSDAVFGSYEKYGGFTIFLGGAAFTLQLYAEFSGYIDIACGVSRLFGIELAQNFDMPFLAQNVADFWRRWHISLGAFFRDYVFYPVSTSKGIRKLTQKLNVNLADFASVAISLGAVWFLTGLWHGASEKYVCYGLYYFFLILMFNLVSPWVEKLLTKAKISPDNKILMGVRILKTWILVLIGMTMFRAENVSTFFAMMASVFHGGERFELFQIMEAPDFVVLILSTLTMVAGAILKLNNFSIDQKFNELTPCKKYAVCFIVFCVVMIFGAYGLDYIAPDPIYGGF